MLPAPLHEPLDPEIARMVSQLERRAATCRYPAPLQKPASGPDHVAPATSFESSAQDVADAGVLLEWCRERVGRAVKAARAMVP